MKKIFSKAASGRILEKAAVAAMALVMLAAAVLQTSQTITPKAYAAVPAPVVGIQAAESLSSGCTVKVTNAAFSNDPASFTGFFGNTDCVRIWLSDGVGPFNQDFRIGVRMQNPKLPGGWGPWGFTPWASTVGTLGQWSPWVGDIQNAGSDPGFSYYQITLQTQPLPPSTVITNVRVGIEAGDDNVGGSFPPFYCLQPPQIQGQPGPGFSSGGGVWSSWSGSPDVSDCTRVDLAATVESFNGAPTVSNLPSSVAASSVTTVGTDANPLSITMQNTGNTVWDADIRTGVAGSGIGTCQADTDADGVLDSPSRTAVNDGKSCTVTYNLSSSQVQLQHVSGSFTAAPAAVSYQMVAHITKTVSVTADTTPCDLPLPLRCRPLPPIVTVDTTSDVPLGISPGSSVAFKLASLTAPAVGGSYTESWQLWSPAVGNFGIPLNKVITVTGGAAGNITVSSRNSVLQTSPVAASWDFTAQNLGLPLPDPCTITGNICSNLANATYGGLLSGTYHFQPLSAPGYSFRSIEEKHIAAVPAPRTKPLFASLFSVGKDLLLQTAHAFAIPSSSPQDQLLSGSGTISFIVLWSPTAAMTLNPATLTGMTASTSTTSQNVTISNTGSPGSTLDWSTNVVYGNGAGWLSVSPSSGSGIGVGSSNTMTVSANPVGLPPGIYNATVTVTPVSHPDTTASVLPQVIPVKFTVTAPPAVCGNGVVETGEACDNGAANGVCPAACSAACTAQACAPQPVCSFTASPTKVVIPQQTNLTYSCQHVTQCSLYGGQFGPNPGRALSVTGTTANGVLPASPTQTQTTYTLNCYGEDPPPGSNVNYQKTVNVNVTVAAPGRVETSSPF